MDERMSVDEFKGLLDEFLNEHGICSAFYNALLASKGLSSPDQIYAWMEGRIGGSILNTFNWHHASQFLHNIGNTHSWAYYDGLFYREYTDYVENRQYKPVEWVKMETPI